MADRREGLNRIVDLAPAEDVSGYSCTLHQALAAEVRAGLRDLGLPQSWLAVRTGLSQKHVSQMLTGSAEGSLVCWDRLLNAVVRRPFADRQSKASLPAGNEIGADPSGPDGRDPSSHPSEGSVEVRYQQAGAALIAQPEPAPYTESGEAATKTRVVSVRFTEAEFAALTALAAERGITPSKALRLAWFLIERLEATAHV